MKHDKSWWAILLLAAALAAGCAGGDTGPTRPPAAARVLVGVWQRVTPDQVQDAILRQMGPAGALPGRGDVFDEPVWELGAYLLEEGGGRRRLEALTGPGRYPVFGHAMEGATTYAVPAGHARLLLELTCRVNHSRPEGRGLAILPPVTVLARNAEAAVEAGPGQAVRLNPFGPRPGP